MASFVAFNVSSSVAPDPINLHSLSTRSNPLCSSVSLLPVRSQKRVLFSVKAMGVVKFQGTQKREKHLTEMIEKKILEATEVCQGDPISDECKVAWDEVEEVSQAKADLRRKMEKEDPLEYFCQENPETDECRIYED